MNRLCKLLRHEKGAALVEMALVTPFLFILFLGIFEFGNVLYQRHLITTGIRDAARYLARYPVDRGGPESVVVEAKQIAVYGLLGGVDKRVSWWEVGHITIEFPPLANPIIAATGERAYRGSDPLRIVQVTTNVSYPGLGFLDFLGIGPTLDFSLAHEERYNGY